MAVTSRSPGNVRVTLQEMVLLAVESLHAASPLLAVYAAYSLALKVRVDGLELCVCVVVWWSRHDCDETYKPLDSRVDIATECISKKVHLSRIKILDRADKRKAERTFAA